MCKFSSKCIDIWNSLKLEDYYKTDIHWRQENLQKVVGKLQQGMNLQNTSSVNYEKIEFIKDINGYTRFCLIYLK